MSAFKKADPYCTKVPRVRDSYTASWVPWPRWTGLLLMGLLVSPIALVTIGQFLGFGTGTSLGGVIQITDAANWQSCASAATRLNLAAEFDWCARRPLGVLLMTPIALLASGSTASMIVLQVVILVATNMWLLWGAVRYLALPLWAAILAALLLIWPTYIHASGLTLEALSMVFATSSLAFLIRGFSAPSPMNLVLAGLALTLSFLVRPGNPLLVVYVLGLAVVAVIRYRKVSKAMIAAFMGGLAVLLLGPTLLQAAIGSPVGAASGNVWASLYSAATPENDYWPSAYEAVKEVVPADSPDWEYSLAIRDETLELLRSNPEPFVRQMVSNGATFLDQGILNLALVNPFATPSDGLSLNAALSRGVSLPAFIVSLSVGLWLLSWILLPLFLYTLFVERNRLGNTRSAGRNAQFQIVVLGLITWLGAWIFFAVLGHDEQKRHLAQSVPFIILALVVSIQILAERRQGTSRKSTDTVSLRRNWLVGFSALLAVVSLFAILEGRRPLTSVVLAECSSPDGLRRSWDVVGAAGVLIGAHPNLSPSSWRISRPFVFHLEHSNETWFRERVSELPPGTMAQLRNAEGEVVPVFIDELQMKSLESGGLPVGSCLSEASPESTPGRLGLWVVANDVAALPISIGERTSAEQG